MRLICLQTRVRGVLGLLKSLESVEYFPNFPNFSVPQFGNGQALEVGACPLPYCGKFERWKVWKTSLCCCNPGSQSSPDLQKSKTRIGQSNLCRTKLPYRQRQQERASRVHRDHKLALRAAFAALLLVTTSVVSAAATIQPPELRRTAITRKLLCWNDHADMTEGKGTFQRKYRMKRNTFKNLVALLRPALEQDYCKNSVLAVS